jgi:hypothetical protein
MAGPVIAGPVIAAAGEGFADDESLVLEHADIPTTANAVQPMAATVLT